MLRSWLRSWLVRFYALGAGLLLLLPVAVYAADEPRQVVEQGYQSLKAHIEAGSLNATQSQQELFELLERELTPSIDFPRIARKVMGKYARMATPDQLQAFTQVFKRTLISTYSKGLENLHLLERVDIEPSVLNPAGDRAMVRTQVVLTSGEQYKVDYSLFANGEKQWMVENIIVEGLNIGLVFRNQFAHLMETHGSIQGAIANWQQPAAPEASDATAEKSA